MGKARIHSRLRIGIAMKLTAFFRILTLAALIFVGGKLGYMLAVPPGYASPMWPPAGIALAALLIWGRQLWPGVWLGSLLINIWVGGTAASHIGASTLISAACIATGSTLQALAAVWLSHRYLGAQVPRLDNQRESLTFIALTGPLACLIAPVIGIGSLLALGIIPAQSAMFSWWNWWIGDSLGAIILPPLIFSLFAHPREIWAPRRLSILLPLSVSFMVLIVAFSMVKQAENTRIQLEFNIRAAAIEKALSIHIDRLLSGSLAVRDLFLASDSVDRKEFSMISRHVMERFPEIQTLEWLPLVKLQQLKAFERAARKEGYKDFHIMEKSPDGSLVPVAPREEYFPVFYLEPLVGNEKAFGLDSASNPLSREAKEIASRSGKPTVSQRLKLIQETGDYHAVLISIPVFDYDPANSSPPLKGFVSGLVHPGNLVEHAMRGLDLGGLHIQLHDLDAPLQERELYSDTVSRAIAADPTIAPLRNNFSLANRTWQITIRPDQDFGVQHGSSMPWITLIGGLMFTGLLGIYLLTTTGHIAHTRKLIAERTRDLQQSENRWAALFENMTTGFAVHEVIHDQNGKVIDYRFLEVNPAFEKLTGTPREALIGKTVKQLMPETEARWIEHFGQVATTGKPGEMEDYSAHLGRWFYTYAYRPMPGQFAVLIQDVTDRKQADLQFHRLVEDMQATLEAIPDLLFELDINGRYIAARSRRESLLALPKNELVGKYVTDVMPANAANIVLAALTAANSTGSDYGRIIRLPLAQGDHWFELSVARKTHEGTDETSFILLSRDITKRVHAEDQLRLASRVFDETHEGISITDANGIIIDVNPTFTMITGYTREEAIGNNPRILKSGRQTPEFFAAMWKSLIEEGHWKGEIWNRKKNGAIYAELLTISALRDEHGKTVNYVGLFSDITQIKQQQQTLEQMAHYDALTQLPNRVLFADRFTQAVARARRDKTLLAICYIDLDGFKQVNDTLGHEAGDFLLVEVADRIRRCLREEDTVSRLGGDEFALLLGDLTSEEQCEQAIERLHLSIAEPYTINDYPVSIAASSGVTMYPNDDADPDTLLRHADQAMYQAKLQGRNRYFFFDPTLDQQLQRHRNELHVIEDAFSRREFCLYYQPKVNMHTGEVLGAEALIRWNHPERGVLPPSEFLPAIADTPLENLFGNWVMEEALRQLDEWRQAGLNLQVSINISPRHLQSVGFYSELETALGRYPETNSRRLELEVLESNAMEDLTSISKVIDDCFNLLGVPFALDDFGTGYSSLTHLRRLYTSTVKIDQSFVRDMVDDPNDFAIVEGVIGLSKAFRRDIIAEGVETIAHGLILISMECPLGQGYAIARPMPPEKLPGWIAEWKPYQEWQRLDAESLDRASVQRMMLRIALDEWLARMEKNLRSDESDLQWPLLSDQKNHLGRWITGARRDMHINQEWLRNLGDAHVELCRIGYDLWQKHQSGQRDHARMGIPRLQATFQAVLALLDRLPSMMASRAS